MNKGIQNVIKDDKYEVVIEDVAKLQTKPSQFIGALGSAGSLHLVKEAVNNAIDECISPQAMGKDIKIHFVEKDNTITVIDNSRGIPVEVLVDVFTILTSSTKLRRQQGGGTLGENGSGQKCITALSENVSVVSYRMDKKYKADFKRGRLQGKVKEAKNDGSHGLSLTFQPSPIFLGKDCRIIPEDLKDWVEKIHYMLPTDIKITLVIEYIDKAKPEKTVYKNKDGMLDFVTTLVNDKKLSTGKIMMQNSLSMPETLTINEIDPKTGEDVVTEIVEERFIGIEFAMAYEEGSGDEKQSSFCNFCHTTEGGVHMDAVKSGIITYMIDETSKTITNRDSKDLKITPRDVTTDLILGVYLSTSYSPMFVAQIKNRVGNGALHAPIRRLTLRALENYFKENPSKLKEFTLVVKTNAKARVAGNKARKAVIKENHADLLAIHRNTNLIAANVMSKNAYRELFITEGGSAGNENARFDPNTQALFLLKGFFMNTFNKDISKVLENKEAKNLIKALGCNIGPKYDINKLLYNKIIILTDSDSDGYGISNIICAFFVYHYPEIVEKGYLYKAVAPLYQLKNNTFIRDRKEYVEEFRKNIASNIILTNPSTKKKLTNKDMETFIDINKDYLEELMKIEAHYSIHRDIIDFLVSNIGDKKLATKLRKRFPELSIDKDVIVGIYDGQYQRLIVDQLFLSKIKVLIKIIEANKSTSYETIITRRGTTENKGVLPLGKIMEYADLFRPDIKTRFKGLGELNTEDLKKTTFNPNNRKLLRLTVSDIERELERFNILHGNALAERKELFTEIDIDKELLDN